MRAVLAAMTELRVADEHTGMHTRLRGALKQPVRGRPWKTSGYTDRASGTRPVRHASVDTATSRSAALQGDTRRDREETPRQHEISQLAGRFRRWWQVMGSNHRRLSRRFTALSCYSRLMPPDLRLCDPGRDSGRPLSAMRPWAPGSGVRAVHRPWRNRPRTATDQPTDGDGKGHGRGRWDFPL